MSPDHAEFDDRLQQVKPPAGLASRLRAIPDWSDADLDAQLAAVELPKGLLVCLHDLVDDALLDEALRSVPVPSVALARARVVPDRRNAPQWLRLPAVRWAIAASLILLVWGGYLGAIVSFAGGSRPEAPLRQIVWIDHSPLQLDAGQIEPATTIIDQDWDSPLLATTAEYQIPDPIEPDMPTEFIALRARPGPLAEMQAVLDREQGRITQQQFLLIWDYLKEQSPIPVKRAAWELAAVAPASTSTALWQTNAPQPHLFMVDRSPVFSPGNDRRLETSAPWISQRTTTFDWATAMAAAGRFPAGEGLHVADFLAAIDHDSLQLPPGKVQWEAIASVSPQGLLHHGVRPIVLQVGVQAGGPVRADTAPLDIQLAIDTSASMGAGRLEASRLALDRFFQVLGAQDRVSLLGFAQQPQPPSAWLARQQRERWQKALTSLTVSDLESGDWGDWGTGLHAALEHAIERAELSSQSQGRVVLISDSDWIANPLQQAALERLMARAQIARLRVDVIHLGPTGQTRRLLARLAESTGGACAVAAESFEIYRALAAIVAGGEPTLANRLALKVRFDPKQVAAYRLIGDHAPSIIASEQGDSISLAAGESASAMYEIWLRPDAAGSPFTAEAQWDERATGKTVRRKRSFSVSELATSVGDSSVPSLWLSSLAMATADALRPIGTEAEVRERIDRVLQAARNGSSSLQERSDVRRMIGLLEASRETLPPTRR